MVIFCFLIFGKCDVSNYENYKFYKKALFGAPKRCFFIVKTKKFHKKTVPLPSENTFL